jgi:uncharacterized protein YjbJ (UPF0337 family)
MGESTRDSKQGIVEGLKGKLKQAAGSLTSDRDLQAEGRAQQDRAEAEREAAKRETEAARARAEAEVAEARQEGHERMR